MNSTPVPFDGEFESYLSQIIQRAAAQDEELAKAGKRTSELKGKSDTVRRMIENNEPSSLTIEECEALIKYLAADNDLVWNEHRICYLKGLTDGIQMEKTVG